MTAPLAPRNTGDLTPVEVAAQLGIAPHAVRRLIRAGALEAYDLSLARGDRSGHRPTYRVTPTALERFRRSRTVRV